MKKRTIIELLLFLITIVLTANCTSGYLIDSSSSVLKTKLALRQQQQQLSPSRCLNLCQNDQYCKSGQCILTECSDTVACYKYCMLCNNQMNCYQTGEFCSYNSSARQLKNNINSYKSTRFLLLFFAVLATFEFYKL